MQKDIENTYGIWLSEQMDELCIVQKEMADATGISAETIRRYKNGDNPSPANKEKIAAYLEEKSKYSRSPRFRHIGSKEFKAVLLELLEEFRGEIVMEELARAAGLSGESAISKRLSFANDLKFSTAMQYDLLYYFLKHCGTHPERWGNSVIHHKHRHTYYRLYGLIENKDYSYIEAEQSELINYLLKLPLTIQEIILSAPGAFFDTARYVYRKTKEFVRAKDFIGRYRKMPLNRRLRFVFELEKKVGSENVLGAYDEGFINSTHLNIMSDHVRMMKSAYNRGITGPEIIAVCDDWIEENYDSRYAVIDYRDHYDYRKWREFIPAYRQYDKQKQELKLETAVNEYTRVDLPEPFYINDIDAIVDDIEYRLDMCRTEWYIWMLFVQHINKKHETDSIYKLLEEVDAGMHRETEMPIDEFHCRRIEERDDFTYLDPNEDESIRKYLDSLYCPADDEECEYYSDDEIEWENCTVLDENGEPKPYPE